MTTNSHDSVRQQLNQRTKATTPECLDHGRDRGKHQLAARTAGSRPQTASQTYGASKTNFKSTPQSVKADAARDDEKPEDAKLSATRSHSAQTITLRHEPCII